MLENDTAETQNDNPFLRVKYAAKHWALETGIKVIATKALMKVYEDMCDIQGMEEAMPDLERYRQLEYGFIFDCTHTSHADGPFLSFPVRTLTRRLGLDGARLLAAASMRTGNQGEAMRLFSHAFDPRMRENGLIMLDSVRPKDRKNHGLANTTLGNVVQALRSPEQNMAIAMLAEGSVQAGRTNPLTGLPYGQIPPENETIHFYQKAFGRYKGKIVILPMAIIGTHLIFSPDNLSVTPYARKELIKHFLPYSNGNKIITIKLGMPYTVEDMIGDGVDINNIDELRRYLMSKKSLLLPEELQGQYKV